MSKLGEVMASSRSCRVHGDPKKKISSSAHEVEHQAPGTQIQEVEVNTRHCRVEEPLTWLESGKIIVTSEKVPMLTNGRSSGGIVEAGFW
jgi:CO/xanthine dehydrogenase Mo-binding subunit